MNKQKGFTIIELIVVIAIIAVLAGIVLLNVTGYINKGKNAAVQGNLANIITNAADYFSTNPTNSGSTYIAQGIAMSARTAADNAVKITSGNTPTYAGDGSTQAWCACNALLSPVGTTCVAGSTCSFCVDSTGNKKVISNACSSECSSSTSYACM